MSNRIKQSAHEDVSQAKSRPACEMFLRIAGYLYRYRGFGLATMICAILTTLLGLIYPKLTQVMIDQIMQQRYERLGECALVLAGAFIFRDLFNSLRIRLNNTFEQHVIFDIRCDLYQKLQNLPVGYFDKRATGDIMTRVIDDVTSLERVLIDGTEQGTVAILTILVVGILLFFKNTELALLAMIPIPVLAIGAFIYTKTAHQRYRIQRRAVSAMNALLHDNLQGIRQIKLFARQKHEDQRFQNHANELRSSTLKVMKVWALYSPSMSLAAALGVPLILYFGGLKVLHGGPHGLSIGDLVGFLLYLGMFYEPVGRLHGLNQMFQAGRAAGERVFDILDAPSEVVERVNARSYPDRVRGELQFENVHFQYVNQIPVLHQIDFQVRAGQTIALVGPTGAGKSTIFNLIPRFYETTQGKILLDGKDIRDITLSSLRDQIAMVTQEPFLFNGTIRENILYGKLDASESELIAAARAANANEFIDRLSEGYDSRVGERGVKLSVGEKQRISIARALLKDPPVLLLDEATASVDTQTERLIQEALERLMSHRTSILIAHRLSTVRHADLILVLERGRIIERGTHEELLAFGSLYSRLWHNQGVGTIEEGFSHLVSS